MGVASKKRLRIPGLSETGANKKEKQGFWIGSRAAYGSQHLEQGSQTGIMRPANMICASLDDLKTTYHSKVTGLIIFCFMQMCGHQTSIGLGAARKILKIFEFEPPALEGGDTLIIINQLLAFQVVSCATHLSRIIFQLQTKLFFGI